MNNEDLRIVVKHLSKSLDTAAGPLNILQDVNLSIAANEAVAITGPSGSGKTTLLGILAGLDTASSGDVQLLGQELSLLDEEQRAALRAGQVGFVFQSFQLVQGASALQNVLLPLELMGLDQARDRARSSLQQVGLEHRLDTAVERLSGGEQQRVALARAFAVKPKVLFADEPTGNLDATTGAVINELMFDLRDQHGATLVLVTHEAQLAAQCDREFSLNQPLSNTA